MRAGVSLQENDMKNTRKYMGADFTTAFKRKASDFEKRKAKPTKKAKKIKKEESSTSSSSNEAVSKFHE
jgi:hypothetical protein